MQDICKQKGKTEIIAGFEPTGHYWYRKKHKYIRGNLQNGEL
jgi:hypothetical protein